MSTPVLIATYVVHSVGSTTAPLVSPSFTPSNNELILAKLCSWSSAQPLGACSGGGQTFQTAKEVAPAGFFGYSRIDVTTVNTALIGGDGSMTVTCAGTAAASMHSMVVERYASGTQTGNTNAAPTSGAGVPSGVVTTTATGTVISWCSTDLNSRDPATRNYLGSTIEEAIFDGHVQSNSVFYFARTASGAAGDYTVGMDAPLSQAWELAAVAVIGGGGPAVALKAGRHVRVLQQKTVAGNANYVKRRPATVTGTALDGAPRLRVRHTGEVYGNASVGVPARSSVDANEVSVYVTY